MMKAVLVLCLVGQIIAQPATNDDLKRAKTKKPRDLYKGDDQTHMSKVLNGHLQKAEKNTLPCEHWSTEELQGFMAKIAEHRDEDLQQVYKSSQDRRSAFKASLDDHKAQWKNLNHIVKGHPHLYTPQQEAHCREAVMWWVHHLTEQKRESFRLTNLAVPLLPEGPKKQCGRGEGEDEERVCSFINEKNSCDWCHSTQAAHDAGVPGTSVPDALVKFSGPDDGNPKGWDRMRRCDQDQMPRCQLCEGLGGRAWSDKNEDIEITPCEIVANASQVDPKTVAPPLYPKKFTVQRKDGKQGGYSDTLIGWKTDPFCFGFFPQNDSIQPLCYRSEDSLVKYYDIEREATRIKYTVHNEGVFGIFPNITSEVFMVNESMWIMNHLWVVDQCICANPSGGHCHDSFKGPPYCKSYIHRWDTFKSAQYLGREKINVEWIQNHGTGASGMPMELDHFILWAHHVWTDPVSRRLVRAWKPFNGLQVYDPAAWVDDIEDPSILDAPPAKCKKGGAPIRINCDDDGFWSPGKSEGLEHLDALFEIAVSKGPEGLADFSEMLYKAKGFTDSIVV